MGTGAMKRHMIIKLTITVILGALWLYAYKLASFIVGISQNTATKHEELALGEIHSGIGILVLCCIVLMYKGFLVKEMQYGIYLISSRLKKHLAKMRWWPGILNSYVIIMCIVFLCIASYLLISGVVVLLY